MVDKNAPLRQTQVIPLPGVEGRFDHFAVDLPRQHLFVAALGNDTLEILDLRTGKRLHSVKGLRKPTGVAFTPEFNRIFVATGDGETCEVLDGDTFATVQSVKGLPDADNVRYDSAAKQVYVGYGDGALAVIEAATGKRVGDIKLAGHPESFQLEKAGSRLFVNVPTARHVAVVDREKRAVVATWPLDGAQSNFPMTLDEADHRLFVGCRSPARVLVYDTTAGRVSATLPISGDTDDLFYDAGQQRLYVSCGAGAINVLQRKDADHFEALATLPTAAGARTSLFVPELQRHCLAVPHRGAQGAEIRVYATSPAASSAAAAQKTFDFERDAVDAPPAGFTSLATGSGAGGKWRVKEMADAPSGKHVVQQTDANGAGSRFPVLIADEGEYADVEVSVKGKAMAGQEDQAIGLVFRFRDGKSYYIVRANALEDNVRLYKMADGQRLQFAGADVTVSPDQWHTLRAVAKGDALTYYFDGKQLIEARDSTYAKGKVGLWTKADSVTAFDDLLVKSLDAGQRGKE